MKHPKDPCKTGYHILILRRNQFGEHMDTYFYCKYLSKTHRVTYLCWDYERPKQAMPGIEVVYVSRKGSLAARNARYLRAAADYLKKHPVDICFISYFRGCALLKFAFPRANFIFDIRTAFPRQNPVLKFFLDSLLRLESIFFKHVTVISEELADKFNVSERSVVLPLGSVRISKTPKPFDRLNLLYVGTLSSREINKTIEGCHLFIKKHRPEQFSYTIIGDGAPGQVAALASQVAQLGLDAHIKLLGRLPFSRLGPYFETHNIGVSFVPINPAFEHQPATKTFDYLLSGLAVIATRTKENLKVITEENGILITDTPEDFASALETLASGKKQYDSYRIMENAGQYHWKPIVKNLENLICRIAKKDSPSPKA